MIPPVRRDRFDAVARIRLAADEAARSKSGVSTFRMVGRESGVVTVLVADAISFRQLADEMERRWSS